MTKRTREEDQYVAQAMRSLEATTTNFAVRFIKDAAARQEYLKASVRFSQELQASYASGAITAKQAAEAAAQMRNEVMELARLRSSDVGKAYSEKLKKVGKTLDELLDKYAKKAHGKPFKALSSAQQQAIYGEVVKAAGRPQAGVTKSAARLGSVGRGLWFITAGIAFYNIASAEDKVAAAGREAVTIGGGFAGGAAGGAAAGALCGPGAPVCITVGVIIGGALGAILADVALESLGNVGWMPPSSVRIPEKFYCFDRSTPVPSLDGLRRMETLCAGDDVIAYDLARNEPTLARVLAVDVHEIVTDLIEIPPTLPAFDPIRVTPGHWFLHGQQWLQAEQTFSKGLPTTKGNTIQPQPFRILRDMTCKVYNLRTSTGTYAVGNDGFVAAGVVALSNGNFAQ